MKIGVLFRRQGRQSSSSVDCCTCSLCVCVRESERVVKLVCVCPPSSASGLWCWVTLGSVSLCFRGRNNRLMLGQEFMDYRPTVQVHPRVTLVWRGAIIEQPSPKLLCILFHVFLFGFLSICLSKLL